MNKQPPLSMVQRPLAHAAAKGYHAHHFCCPTCIAAGIGVGSRCQTGKALWLQYIAECDAVAAPANVSTEATA